MTKPVRFEREAQEELDAAVAWYDMQTQQWAVGDTLLESVADAVARLAESPAACALAPRVPAALGVRRCQLQTFPFALVFLERPTEIRIVALAHHRRHPGYWRTRL